MFDAVMQGVAEGGTPSCAVRDVVAESFGRSKWTSQRLRSHRRIAGSCQGSESGGAALSRGLRAFVDASADKDVIVPTASAADVSRGIQT